MSSLEPGSIEGLSSRQAYGAGGAPRRSRAVGTLIGRELGPFRVEARLGGGAMASVYRATDLRSGHTVALKVLLPDADDTVRERFGLEARMVSNLEHPHIVRTLEVRTPQGDEDPAFAQTYIAMEMVEGESLADLLERLHTLNVADSCALLAPVARALAYAHSKNVVHRDVKPSNILLRRAVPGAPHAVRLTVLDDPVVPLLSDFGIARALDAPDLTSAGRTIGTPAYMSPEQCAGTREIDGRADLYSLGAVLYRCLVGRSPYTGTTTQILYAHVYDPLTIPDDALRLLSPLMVEILRRAMAKEPADRYATAQAMAQDLAAGRTGPARAPRPGAPDAHSALDTADREYLGLPPLDAEQRPPDQQTMTMPELTAAAAPQTSVRVIVPAPLTTAAAFTTPAATAAAHTPPAPLLPLRPAEAVILAEPPRPRPSLRWRGVFVGLSLAVPMFVLLGLAVGALLDIGPFHLPGRAAAPAAATAALSTAVTPPATSLAVSPAPVAQPTLPNAPVPTATAPAAPTPAVQPIVVLPAATADPLTPAATPAPTPAGDINAYWQQALDAYAQNDWTQAAAYLTLVRRINPQYEPARLPQMLVESHLRSGVEAVRAGAVKAAADEFAKAVALQPQAPIASALATAAATWAAVPATATPALNAPPDPTPNPTLRAAQDALRVALSADGADRLRRNDLCGAADALEAAVVLRPNDADANAATAVRSQCSMIQQAQADQQMLAALPGRLLYSTQMSDGDYRIYIIPAAVGASAAYVIAAGRQPALSPDGVMVAFHSTRPDALGIAGFDLAAGLEPGARSLLFTRSAGDALDSPPAWNATGDSLVFAGVDLNSHRSQIYTVAADGTASPRPLTPGQSPAWSHAGDLIAYNGVDPSGQQPGLWLMRADGSNPVRLTDNGADLRPAWSPDGASVVFMSNGRSGDWDIYRAPLPGGPVMQLTTESAQDGLPAISPDGQYIAFVSDRGGAWNIWVKPLAGGRTLLLAPIEGTLTNWLEHALQWIP